MEFDENSSPNDKGDDNDIDPQYNKKNLIQLLKVERSGFTKHHKDMALKTWLVLLS